MKKLVWEGDSYFRYEEAPDPESIPDGQVLVRPTAVGICGTDIHIIEGRFSVARPPLVLGHEIAGEVERIGEYVDTVKPGDRVTVDQVVGCGKCFFCRKGSRQFCRNGFELGITTDGGCQGFFTIPQENLFKLPDTISDEVAAILDMEVWAAISKCGVGRDDTVLILGPGPAGLVACQLVRLAGVDRVILAGPTGSRMAKARELGLADAYVFTDCEDMIARTLEETGGLGASVAIECAGAQEAVSNALGSVRPGGRIVLYGLQCRAIPAFDLNSIILRDLIVYGALSDRTGWEQVIELVANRQLLLDPLITHRFSIQDAPQAYDFVRRGSTGLIKAVILM